MRSRIPHSGRRRTSGHIRNSRHTENIPNSGTLTICPKVPTIMELRAGAGTSGADELRYEAGRGLADELRYEAGARVSTASRLPWERGSAELLARERDPAE